ncbi:hypothetical protein H7F28_20190 [Brevibacterium sp. PAMC23299]|nr:hypothetical protein H7F28_20190 [Brevibacterium sp. PAMC23299]
MSKEKVLLQPKELSCIRLPYDIQLDSLVGKPHKCEWPYHSGLYCATVRIFTFRQKIEVESLVDIVFDNHYKKDFLEIVYYCPGIERLSDEAFMKLQDIVKNEELSILNQALIIMKGMKRSGIYCNAIEKYISKNYL